jgi:hypothetical protein
MALGIMDYIRAAFHARPWGMVVPPNWLGLGAFALLGLLNPGFWLMGIGAELAYLYSLTSSARFRHWVDATSQDKDLVLWQKKLAALVGQLIPPDQARYRALESRCQSVLSQRGAEAVAGSVAQNQGLGRLMWIYLRLLLTRQSIRRLLAESTSRDTDRRPLETRIAEVQQRLDKEQLSDDLRKSLASQVDILKQRLLGQQQGKEKLDFMEAELTRIEEQVELIREQAVLVTDPQSVSQRIDQVAATLGGTTQWIRDQQQIYGQVEDLLSEPPAIVPQQAIKS